MVGRWAGTKAFLPRRVLHARENEDQAPKGRVLFLYIPAGAAWA